MSKPRLHLPNIPKPPPGLVLANKHRMLRMKTPNPFPHMSGSIAATQKRNLVKSPKQFT